MRGRSASSRCRRTCATTPRPSATTTRTACARRAGQPRPRLKIALVTGALAFVIAAGVVTASELALFGGSVSSDRRTSLFGGQKSSATKSEEDKADEEATPTATPEDGATPTPTPTASPEATATPSPTPSATATPVQPNVTITPAPTP